MWIQWDVLFCFWKARGTVKGYPKFQRLPPLAMAREIQMRVLSFQASAKGKEGKRRRQGFIFSSSIQSWSWAEAVRLNLLLFLVSWFGGPQHRLVWQQCKGSGARGNVPSNTAQGLSSANDVSRITQSPCSRLWPTGSFESESRKSSFTKRR